MRIGLYFIICCFALPVLGQLTEKYEAPSANFYMAEELMHKKQFSAAQKHFRDFIDDSRLNNNHPHVVKARYQEVICALELYNNNITSLFEKFLRDYPETNYKTELYFKLGLYHYQKKDFEETLLAFSKINPFDLPNSSKTEFYFKKGYAAFNEEDYKTARNAFYEVKDSVSPYQEPATYYYGHISYSEGAYTTALESFLKLNDSENFKTVVPYYIVQIYHRMKQYEELVTYSSPFFNDNFKLHKEDVIAYLTGDAYYRLKKYDESVPYFEAYARKNTLNREENYKMGYAYYKSKMYKKAIPKLQGVGREKDEMGQKAMYHLAESYLQTDQADFAKNAFKEASEMSFDADIEEDALFKHALIAYQLDYNPYDEAIKAFQLYLERYPNSSRKTEVYQYMVNVFTTTKNYRSAIESLEKINDKDARLKMAYQIMAFNYGVEMLESNRYSKAVKNFRKVKTYPIDPKLNALSLYWTADAHFRQKDYKKAIQYYRNFTNESGAASLSQFNHALYNIGYAYYYQDDYISALQSFRSFDQAVGEENKKMKADALLRIGDCFFLTKEDKQAQEYYQRAIDIDQGYEDYALYQIAVSEGYQGEYDNKIKRLLDIINNYPQSTYKVIAIFEVAETYQKKKENNSDALKYYDQILRDYPNNIKAQSSVFEMGVIYFQKKQYDKAEKMFLRVLNEYNNAELSRMALKRLKDVYIALGTPDKYYELAESSNLANISEFEKDSTSYEVAYTKYFDSSFVDAISLFSKYLRDYPNGIFKIKAHYYRAVSYERTDQKEKAIEDYEVISEAPINNFSEGALLKASRLRYEKEDYQKALEYYKKLESAASFENNIHVSRVGQMRCYHYLENDEYAISYANKVMQDAMTKEETKTEAYYVKGLALKRSQRYGEAIENLSECADRTSGIIGAEAKYNVAEIQHILGEYKASEVTIKELVQQKPSYQYWIAKGFILQSKNLIEMDDLFQAEHTLNSVIKNYKNKDDGILEEANEVLQYIESLKNKKEEDTEDDAPVININNNEDGGNDED